MFNHVVRLHTYTPEDFDFLHLYHGLVVGPVSVALFRARQAILLAQTTVDNFGDFVMTCYYTPVVPACCIHSLSQRLSLPVLLHSASHIASCVSFALMALVLNVWSCVVIRNPSVFPLQITYCQPRPAPCVSNFPLLPGTVHEVVSSSTYPRDPVLSVSLTVTVSQHVCFLQFLLAIVSVYLLNFNDFNFNHLDLRAPKS